MKFKIKEKEDGVVCATCGKKITNNWVRCYKLYFCTINCLNKYESQNNVK